MQTFILTITFVSLFALILTWITKRSRLSDVIIFTIVWLLVFPGILCSTADVNSTSSNITAVVSKPSQDYIVISNNSWFERFTSAAVVNRYSDGEIIAAIQVDHYNSYGNVIKTTYTLPNL
jgi:hypothetical protein